MLPRIPLTRVLPFALCFMFAGCDEESEIENECGPGCDGELIDVVLVTQSEIDEFGARQIRSIPGSLTIGNGISQSGIHTLEPLKDLESVGKDLNIFHNTELATLDGLENLKSVGNSLTIQYNVILENIDGIRNLTSSNIGVYLKDNPELADLSPLAFLTNPDTLIIQGASVKTLAGLDNVTSIDGPLYIYNCYNLENFDVLENLTSIGGSLTIDYNNKLNNLNGLRNVEEVGGQILIWNNNYMTTFGGFQKLRVVEGDLKIQQNRNMVAIELAVEEVKGSIDMQQNSSLREITFTNLNSVRDGIYLSGHEMTYSGFSALTLVNGDLVIAGESAQANQGFINLQKVAGDLTVTSASGDLDDLANLEFVDGNFKIERSDITSVNGLASLKNIGGNVTIEHNPHLLNLDGLGAVNEIRDGVKIHSNKILKDFCGLTNVFQNGETDVKLSTFANAFNPTKDQILAGDCSR